MMESETRSYLRRLGVGAYQGNAIVHWIYTIEGRKLGWLDDEFHLDFREALLHSLSSYGMCCPVYCLMPDHVHLLICGLEEGADQLKFSKRLRRDFNMVLEEDYRLQKQGYDHVLRDGERETGAFETMANYMLENPVRKGLVGDWTEYNFSGCLFPGYFGLSVKGEGYWEKFWKLYNRIVTKRR